MDSGGKFVTKSLSVKGRPFDFEEKGMGDFRKNILQTDFEWKKKILQGNIRLCASGKNILSPEVWKK